MLIYHQVLGWVYIYGHLPHQLEPYNCQRPNLAWECTAYVHVPKDDRGELDSKTEKYALIWYGNVQKGYKVDPRKNKVLYSRNIVFYEQETNQAPTEEKSLQRTLTLAPFWWWRNPIWDRQWRTKDVMKYLQSEGKIEKDDQWSTIFFHKSTWPFTMTEPTSFKETLTCSEKTQ